MVFTEETLGNFLEAMVEKNPDQEFMVYPDRNLRFTYKEFDERANQMAKGITGDWNKKGRSCGYMGKNVPDWLTYMFATAKIGVVLVTVNTAYKSHELAYVLEQSDMKALAIIDGFQDVDYIQTLYELIPELKSHERGKLKSEKFPFLESIIYLGQENTGECTTPMKSCYWENMEMRSYSRRSKRRYETTKWSTCSIPLEPPDFPKALC